MGRFRRRTVVVVRVVAFMIVMTGDGFAALCNVVTMVPTASQQGVQQQDRGG